MSGVALSEDPKPDRPDHKSGFEEDAIRNSLQHNGAEARACILAHL
jgi:hypothetical protein